MKRVDEVVMRLDKLLRVMTGVATSSRRNPGAKIGDAELDVAARRHSVGLMRVNHVGEVCAQALYDSQAHFAESEFLKEQFTQAGREEEDHLAWTAERLRELGSRTSLLNPLWYAGSYAIGAIAAKLGDARSLGFVVETERQVEAHLVEHLTTLPADDLKSRAIVEQMRADEVKHGANAQALGAADMPAPLRNVMKAMAKVMTATAYYI